MMLDGGLIKRAHLLLEPTANKVAAHEKMTVPCKAIGRLTRAGKVEVHEKHERVLQGGRVVPDSPWGFFPICNRGCSRCGIRSIRKHADMTCFLPFSCG